MRLSLLLCPLLCLLACRGSAPSDGMAPLDTGSPEISPISPRSPRGHGLPERDSDAPVRVDPTVTEEELEAWTSPVFSDDDVMNIEITLSEDAIGALRIDPDAYVEGSVTAGGHTWAPVGVRLKGSASWQPIDLKCNWKLKFEDYTDERFYGLKRLTLNNNIWDSSAMAQDLAYHVFEEAGVPSPRTGYAWVSLNGEVKGLYTVLESMDGQIADREFPGTEGNLYETTYLARCDFDTDGSCFELQVTGEGEPDVAGALASATAAVAEGTPEALREAFDWEDLLGFLAVERVINHPDSYSYNLNNFFVYHDPTEDQVSLLPWGADSTFVYTYPPTSDDYPCSSASYRDVLTSGSVGALARLCEADAGCLEELRVEMGEVADLLDELDLVERVRANRERLRPYIEEDPGIVYTVDNFDKKVECFETWIAARPAEMHAWLGF